MSYLLTKQADLVAEFSKKEATFLQRLEEKELELLVMVLVILYLQVLKTPFLVNITAIKVA